MATKFVSHREFMKYKKKDEKEDKKLIDRVIKTKTNYLGRKRKSKKQNDNT